MEEVDPIELTSAYQAFAADGIRRTPETMALIRSSTGERLWLHQPSGVPVLEPHIARSVNQVLEGVVESGTGTRARVDGHHIAGKTGTTDSATDAWFIGYSAHHVTTVWLGTATVEGIRQPIRVPGYSSFGGGLPATIWQNYMGPIHTDLDPVPFVPPPTIDREPVLLEAENEIDQ